VYESKRKQERAGESSKEGRKAGEIRDTEGPRVDRVNQIGDIRDQTREQENLDGHDGCNSTKWGTGQI
jgi:hypothetical protein